MSDPSNTAQASTDAGAGQAAADGSKPGADAQASLLSTASAADAKADGTKQGTDPNAAKPDPNAKPEGDGKKDDAEADKAKVPEKYELTMPEGMQLDEAALAEATPLFKEYGLSNEQANKLAALYAKQVEKLAASSRDAMTQQHEGWKNATLTDKEFGGDALIGKDGKPGPNLIQITAAIDRVAGEQATAFKEMLDQTGAGNHPEMGRFLYRVGKMVGEGSMVRGDAAAAGDRAAEDVLYPSMKKGT